MIIKASDKNIKMNEERLLSFGFLRKKKGFTLRKTLSIEAFECVVIVDKHSNLRITVFDNESEGEYILFNNPSVQGQFVEKIKHEVRLLVEQIINQCFDKVLYHGKQTSRMIEAIYREWGINPEFLWDKFPSYSIYRHSNSKKWFAIIMNLDASKLDSNASGSIEVIVLKTPEESLVNVVDYQTIYPGYHMNKKYWITVVLDKTLSDETVFEKIKLSHQLTS